MNLRDIQAAQGRVEHKSMNELRAILYQRGIEFPDDASRQELERLVKEVDR